MRLPYLLTLCLLVCNCAWAQPLPPDTPALDEGSLHGQVICDDGLPFEGATGTVSGAGQTVDFTTDKDGFFLVTLKAGAASILIADTVTKTLIQAGTTVAAQARVKRPGVVVTVHGADGKAYTGVVNGEAFGTDNSWRDCTVHPLGEGRYWFFEAGVTLVKLAATIPTVFF